MTNAIVAAPTSGTTSSKANQAQSLLTNIKSTADAMERGDVLGSAMGVANVAIDVIGIAGDPMGAISSAGVGWVLNAVKFLREPFDVLMGNPSAITSSAQSWMTASRNLSQTAAQYRQAATTQTCNWTGAAGNGYRTASANQANGLESLAKAAQAVSGAMTQAGKALAAARKVVMDLISEAVNKIIQICIEALSSSWLSFGASIALGIAQSVQKAVSTAQKLLTELQKAISTLQKIIQTVQQILSLVQQVKQLLDQIGGKATGGGTVRPAVQSQNYAPIGDHNPNAAGTQAQSAQVLPGTPVSSIPQVNPGTTQAQSAQVLPGAPVSSIPQVRPGTTQPAQAAPGVQPTPVRRPPQTRPPQQGGRVSQNGWPVNPPRSPHTIPGTNVRVTVADGPAGQVLMHVLGQVNARVEDIAMNSDRNERDDWGYAERNVRGSEAVSNHASGTAVDINATRHALGASGTFTPAQVAEIHRILAEVDGVVRWGGDYTGRRDEMHFEIIGSQEQVARVAERLRQAH
jgi:hypothetical protein